MGVDKVGDQLHTGLPMDPAFWDIHAKLSLPCSKEVSTTCWLPLGSSCRFIKGVLEDPGRLQEDSQY